MHAQESSALPADFLALGSSALPLKSSPAGPSVRIFKRKRKDECNHPEEIPRRQAVKSQAKANFRETLRAQSAL